ncbi:MAG: preprotein translocase subunit SecE [Minisyncoccia bacterium]
MKRTIVRNRPQGRFNFANHICMSHFINYLKDTFAELKHVSWPTNKQSLVYTALVVGLSTLIALYVGLFDFVFSRGLDWFIK